MILRFIWITTEKILFFAILRHRNTILFTHTEPTRKLSPSIVKPNSIRKRYNRLGVSVFVILFVPWLLVEPLLHPLPSPYPDLSTREGIRPKGCCRHPGTRLEVEGLKQKSGHRADEGTTRENRKPNTEGILQRLYRWGTVVRGTLVSGADQVER